jgi:hypothetical protein
MSRELLVPINYPICTACGTQCNPDVLEKNACRVCDVFAPAYFLVKYNANRDTGP